LSERCGGAKKGEAEEQDETSGAHVICLTKKSFKRTGEPAVGNQNPSFSEN